MQFKLFMQKPALARGTRDFEPEIMIKRNFIFETIKRVYRKYGFLPLETPAIENLNVLMGKYGEEGDQLLFKILNSGNYLKDVKDGDLPLGAKTLLTRLSEKGLKYDLTVPFARYVAMNRHELTMPFKRYQIQPVWRADRPQKGRYREFYQCDADVIGTDSLLCEAEIVAMLTEIFQKLDIHFYEIKINSRKILNGIAETIGAADRANQLFVSLDKLDKIGQEKVVEELINQGFSRENIQKLQPLFDFSGDDPLPYLKQWIGDSDSGKAGIHELIQIYELVEKMGGALTNLKIDPTLARGLSYYTGAIFEVKVLNVIIGSISGGGRYDNLTGAFGQPGLSGVGISLGVDRIFDVMTELKLFPENLSQTHTQVLVTHFDDQVLAQSLNICQKLRQKGINAEIYLDAHKIKKQFDYANKKRIPYVLIIGSEEVEKQIFKLKDLETGQQMDLAFEQIIESILSTKNNIPC